jgi:hypothetical protein
MPLRFGESFGTTDTAGQIALISNAVLCLQAVISQYAPGPSRKPSCTGRLAQ